MYETDANNNITAEYTWDAHGKPVSMTKNGNTYYSVLNGRGDVTALTDSSGSVVAQYQYDSFGNITSQTGSMASSNPYRYAGYRYDETTGLYYLMGRYYDAIVGRFITEDTYKGQADVLLSLNSYTYVQYNPVTNFDPSGNYCVSVDGKWRHAGLCNSPTSTWTPDWMHGLGVSWSDLLVVGAMAFQGYLFVQQMKGFIFPQKPKFIRYSRWGKLSPNALKTIGTRAEQSDIRAVKGTADDAWRFFKDQVDLSTIRQPKPGVYVGTGSNGLSFSYRAPSKSGPPTIGVNGVTGLRKIKFIQ